MRNKTRGRLLKSDEGFKSYDIFKLMKIAKNLKSRIGKFGVIKIKTVGQMLKSGAMSYFTKKIIFQKRYMILQHNFEGMNFEKSS